MVKVPQAKKPCSKKYKKKFVDKKGKYHRVHLHAVHIKKGTCTHHLISVCKHRVSKAEFDKHRPRKHCSRKTLSRVTQAKKSSKKCNHAKNPNHTKHTKKHVLRSVHGLKRIADRKYYGSVFKCWKNVPQDIAFDPRYYGAHRNILVEVPRGRNGKKQKITDHTKVVFCIKK
jgi:hypothetical protein